MKYLQEVVPELIHLIVIHNNARATEQEVFQACRISNARQIQQISAADKHLRQVRQLPLKGGTLGMICSFGTLEGVPQPKYLPIVTMGWHRCVVLVLAEFCKQNPCVKSYATLNTSLVELFPGTLVFTHPVFNCSESHLY